MATRYLVVSDLHLADFEDHPNGWKEYKGSRYGFDQELDQLVSSFLAQAERGDRLVLVLNGDIIDFDLVSAVPAKPPWPVSRFERKRGLKASEVKSAWKLGEVLRHHPQFLATIAGFMAQGHQVIYVMGNHDRELHFPAVRQVLLDALELAARRHGQRLPAGGLFFAPWFYYVPGQIYVEHGHQYDHYSSFRYLLHPVVRQGGDDVIELTTGNLSNRYLLSRMGYFNPFTGDFILNLFCYLAHWFRHYALTRRSLALNWFWGTVLVVAELLSLRSHRAPPEHDKGMAALARAYGMSDGEIRALGKLQRPPLAHKLFRLLREFWFDRLLLVLLMAGITLILVQLPLPLWAKVMVPLSSFPLVFSIYERAVRGETIFTLEKEMPEHARAVARTLPARVITFGHTHVPRMIPLCRSSVFVDTGTWAPMLDHGRVRDGLKNYLLVSFNPRGFELHFGSWTQESAAAQELGAALEEPRLSRAS